MFQIILALVLLAIIIYYLKLYSGKQVSGDAAGIFFKKEFGSVFDAIKNHQKHTALFQLIRRALLMVTAILFSLLALSGFIPALFFGVHLSGWLLIIHVSIAPFFVISLALLAVFYAHQKQFNDDDLDYLQKKNDKKSQNMRVAFWSKTSLWLFLLFSLPAILSVVLSMYPLFGTYGQEMSLSIHQYSVLVLFGIVAWFFSLKLGQYSVVKETE